MGINNYVALSNSKKPRYSSGAPKKCRVCGKEVAKDNTPSHLYYQSLCSENCKEKYIYPPEY